MKTFFTIICITICTSLFAQLVVNETVTANQIAKLLKRKGIQINNISINCPQGSYGAFAGNTNLGISNGVLLTTGNASESIGPNNNAFATGGNTGHIGSMLLETIPGNSTTIDACEIVIDFNSGCADDISFNYVFGSEEYFETVSTTSDAFAIFISGPGFVGNENIALLPDNSAVNINNVNDVNNIASFVNNGDGNTAPQNTDNSVIQYDGFTQVLNAQANLVLNSNYIITFVIADAIDGGLDSGVFIEDGNAEDLFKFGAFTSVTNSNTIIEDCAGGIVNIEVLQAIFQNTDLQLLISGAATNGVDFIDGNTNTAVTSLINIAPGTTNVQFEVLALQDNLTEAIENIRFEILDTCGNIIDSLEIEITEAIELTSNTNDTLVCNGNPVQLSVSGSNNFTWQPTNGLSCTDCADPIANPTVTTTYYISSNIGGNCTTEDSILVQVFESAANAGIDKALCTEFDFVEIGPDTTSNNLIYEWLDINGNFISNQANLTIGTTELQQYGNALSANFVLNVSTNTGCNASDEVTVVLDGNPQIAINAERDTIFKGENVQLNASGAGNEGNYVWDNIEILNNPEAATTFARPEETTTFTVTGFTENGCFASIFKTIIVEKRPTIIVPTAFSPNEDGENDKLVLTEISLEDLEIFQIYNRYGELVYEARDITDIPWDGKFKNIEQPIGVFTYHLVAKGLGLDQKIIKRGNITVIR